MTLRSSYSDSLARLLKGICKVPAALDTQIYGLALDSRQVKKGDLFLALSGSRSAATDHINEAVSRGANAVIAEGNLNQGKAFEDGFAVELFVDNLREKIGLIADRFFRSPSLDVSVIGVTGTNGKTSVTNYLANYFSYQGQSSGIIGTLGYGVVSQDKITLQETGFTTPNVVEVHRCLAELRDAGVKNVFMEVSSHGLSQNRVDGVRFEGAVFTNLSREHLDYHGTMQAYAESKMKLFVVEGLKFAVINRDDDYADSFLKIIPPTVNVLTYGLSERAQIYAPEYQLHTEGSETIQATVNTPSGVINLQSGLIGIFNLSNLLAVVAVAEAKQALTECEKRISKLRSVSGRMQVFKAKGRPSVVVDYAHTPDALEKALNALKPHCEGKIVLVFGCGGDRDPGKRPQMAEIAERLADLLIVTDDNPRNEDPEKITREIVSGFSAGTVVTLEHDRRKAIRMAIDMAGQNDLVLIAGKGHETWQEIKGVKKYFSDIEQVKEMLGLKLCTDMVEASA